MKSTEFDLEQFNAIYPEGIERHYWQLARVNIIADALYRLPSAKSAVMLEVGCGRGVVVKPLREKGFNIRGVELAEVPVADGVTDYVEVGKDATTLPEAYRKTVEVILLLDVIEHIENPQAFLQQLKTAYPALRHFVITVPGCQDIFSNYDDFLGHFRRYDLAMVDDLAVQTRTSVVRKSFFFHSLYPPAWLTLRFVKKRKTEIPAPQGFANTIHALLSKIFFLDYKLLPASWKGTSVLMVLQTEPA